MSEPDAVHSPVFCYRLLAQKSAGVAPRVIEYFAKRDLVPERFDCRAGPETLAIEVEVAGLEDEAARHIARCLANIVEVQRVAVAHLQPLARPQVARVAKTEGLRASA